MPHLVLQVTLTITGKDTVTQVRTVVDDANQY